MYIDCFLCVLVYCVLCKCVRICMNVHTCMHTSVGVVLWPVRQWLCCVILWCGVYGGTIQ